MHDVAWWRTTLKDSLREAMRARQTAAVSVLRTTLGALDNAEAAELKEAPAAQPGIIAGGVAGLGAGEVARRVLTPEEVDGVIRLELSERMAAAAELGALGRAEEAATLREQAQLLEALLAVASQRSITT